MGKIKGWKKGVDYKGDNYYTIKEEKLWDEFGEPVKGEIIDKETIYITKTPEYHLKKGFKKWALAISTYESPPVFIITKDTKKEIIKEMTKYMKQNPNG